MVDMWIMCIRLKRINLIFKRRVKKIRKIKTKIKNKESRLILVVKGDIRRIIREKDIEIKITIIDNIINMDNIRSCLLLPKSPDSRNNIYSPFLL